MSKDYISELLRIKDVGLMEPFISYIRFPCYRNLESGVRVDFFFPITALVGQNGTNKSSVLRALYGCPNGTSVGNFWFSTKIDPIDEDGGRSRFIYSYYSKDAGRQVEVIKSRIKRKARSSSGRERVNPDYWEPSRPLLGDGMDEMPEYVDGMKGRTKTRWNAMDKNVVYLDFRSQISAYDKYFYHGELKQTLNNGSKQDFIRSRSPYLKEVVDKKLTSKRIFKGAKEHVYENFEFDAKLVAIVSNILSREYKSVRIVEHRFFNVRGRSVILGLSDFNYSEAFAGSGEFAVAVLVYELSTAPEKSLILLDEPEVSLHPGAQIRMMEFIAECVRKMKHQIVLGTHSPFIIQNLPEYAIKTLYMNSSSGRVEITSSTMKDEAFYHLGAPNAKKVVYVEDKLAKEVVERAIKNMGRAVYESLEVKYFSGGASVLLLKYLPYNAFKGSGDVLFLMDGDQFSKSPEYESGDYCYLDCESLKRISSVVFSGNVELNLDGGRGGENKEVTREKIINVLDYARKYMRFLPDENPEMFIINNTELMESFSGDCSVKDYFKTVAHKDFGKSEFESVSAEEIFACQKIYLAKIDSKLFGVIENYIKEFVTG